jgi:endogenous inhibitor of DNA gyrase (YacG/DUF329 family)
MLPTHDVPCPSCGKALYSAVSLEDAVDAGAIESPKVEHDGAGDYMKCPHCARRVAMTRMTVGNAQAWRPARV